MRHSWALSDLTMSATPLLRADDLSGPDLIFGFDGGLAVAFANTAAAELGGATPEQMVGRHVDDFAAHPLIGGLASVLREVAASRVAQRVQAQAAALPERWFDVWVVPRGEGRLWCFARDITEIKQTEAHLRDSAGRDSLTGLLNHAAFHDAASRALASAAADGSVALMLFDLDYLKLINDVHGHQAGDRALRAVADALRGTTRDVDTLARLGGDEFGALFVGVERELVLRIAERALASVRATAIEGLGQLSVSVGVAFLASTREPGDLFDRADAAVYDAKSRGRGVVCVADMTEIAYASRRRDLAEEAVALEPAPGLADARELVTAARGALREWVQVLACSGGCVDLLDADGRSVKAVAYFRFGHDDWKLAEQSYELTDYPNTARALAEDRPYHCRVDDPDADPAETALLRERGFASLLLTPLVCAGRPIGIIELFDTRPRVFTTADQRVALALAHHLAPLLALLLEREREADGGR